MLQTYQYISGVVFYTSGTLDDYDVAFARCEAQLERLNDRKVIVRHLTCLLRLFVCVLSGFFVLLWVTIVCFC